MDIGLMVEGQHGLTWERWLHILHRAEFLGIPTVFRSDHYFIGRQLSSLEAYISLAVAARETSHVRFGPLVTPVTFRSPVDVGRMAAQIDLLSGGRFVLGVGAGWHEPEHRAYGIPFPPPGERTARLKEAIELMRAMWGPGPASYEGRYYRLEGADPLPKPEAGRPKLLIGGRGPKRTLRMVAQYADEWNCVNAPPDYNESVRILESHCAEIGRDPKTIRRSIMNFAIVGPDEHAVRRQAELAARVGARSQTVEEVLATAGEHGRIVGRTEEAVEQLGRLAEMGVQEVQLQHMDFNDDKFLEYVAKELAPRVKDL